jgi:two-component system chemotaxis sensor kinase CheA
MTMFHQAFFEEATDLLTDFEALLLQLEDRPDDPEILNTIFRCAHSIKGGSATFGFADIAQFTHGLETLLDLVRNGQIGVDPNLSQLLFESLDQLRALLAVARGEQASAPPSEALSHRIESAAKLGSAPGVCNTPKAEVTSAEPTNVQRICRLRFVPGIDIMRQGADPIMMMEQFIRLGEVQSVRCDDSRVPSLAELDPEACYLAWDCEILTSATSEALLDPFEFVSDDSVIELIEEPLAFDEADPTTGFDDIEAIETVAADRALAGTVANTKSDGIGAAPAARSADVQSLRVATDKVDKLINLVGELVINQSMLNEVIQNFEMEKFPRLVEAVAQMERASRELQERVMSVRMLPIKHAFGRFPRLVRDLAGSCGKKIELITSGEDTELDKTVIESIADPLTHLVRNSIDHGLETPAERIAAGKPETGHVSLHATQEGGSIAVEVSDDGRGLSRERILAKAIERGLVSEGEAASLSDDTVNNFIFHPGFSTAAQVTDLSGRGVGMDIVKQGVQGLGGTISVTTKPGQGTRFRIKLPLTMAILEGLSVSVGNEVYIMPLTSIVESIRPKASDVQFVIGREEVVQVRGEVLPIVRLYKLFGAEPIFTEPAHALLVIVENEGRKVALLVDELIGQSQIVIKSLEANYRKVDGIAAATILGDGRVALILDIPGLINLRQKPALALAA